MKKIFCLFSILLFTALLFGCPEDSEDSNNSDKNTADLNQLNDFNVFDENVFDLNIVDENATDSNACVEYWECNEFSECINEEKTRRCWDNNECGAVNVFTEIRDCNISDLNAVDQNITDVNALDENRFDENGNCIEKWQCSEWGECVNGWEKRDCIDLHECDSEELKPRLYQHCGECIHEETIDCITDENCSGIQECISGEWEDCVDNPEDNCPGECKNGYERICINYQNCPGTQICSDHEWKTCNDNPYDNCPGGCTSGETRNCTTTENCPGTQFCVDNSWNSECFDYPNDYCPLLCEEQNKTEIELKEGNLYYKDESAVQHEIPFYIVSLSLPDKGTDTIVIDGQTIWFQVDTNDIFNYNGDFVHNGSVLFKKNNSEGPGISMIYYIDKDAVNSGAVVFEGANGEEIWYNVLVDETDSTANVWLFFYTKISSYIISTQYNKFVYLSGTDTQGDPNSEYYFFVPHSPDLPEVLGGGTNYSAEDVFTATFVVLEKTINNDVLVNIDTANGKLSDQSLGYAVQYDRTEKLTSENSSVYTSFGSNIELNNYKFKITIPENTCVWT